MHKRKYIWLCFFVCLLPTLLHAETDPVIKANTIYLGTEARIEENYHQFLRIDSLNDNDHFGVLFLSNYMRQYDFITFADSKNNPDFYKNNPNGAFYLFYWDQKQDELFIFSRYDISFWYFTNNHHGPAEIDGISKGRFSKAVHKQDCFIRQTKEFIEAQAQSTDVLRRKLLEANNEIAFRIQFDIFTIRLQGGRNVLETRLSKNTWSNDALLDIPRRTYESIAYEKIEETITARNQRLLSSVEKTTIADSSLASSLNLKQKIVVTAGNEPLREVLPAEKHYWLFAGTIKDKKIESLVFNKKDLGDVVKDKDLSPQLLLKQDVILRDAFPVYVADSSYFHFGNVNGLVPKGYEVKIKAVKLVPTYSDDEVESIWLDTEQILLAPGQKKEFEKKDKSAFLKK
jgi:hypothetical protein